MCCKILDCNSQTPANANVSFVKSKSHKEVDQLKLSCEPGFTFVDLNSDVECSTILLDENIAEIYPFKCFSS